MPPAFNLNFLICIPIITFIKPNETIKLPYEAYVNRHKNLCITANFTQTLQLSPNYMYVYSAQYCY